MTLVFEQALNGVQLGVLLFLLAAGLTLVFGIMNFVNLAHGSLYMVGAYFAATFIPWSGSFIVGALLALAATAAVGMALEVLIFRRLYHRDHMDQVLATFGLILFFNELVLMVWGPAGLSIAVPSWLVGQVNIIPGVPYPAYRLAVLVTGLAAAAFLYVLVSRTRTGMRIRAGASDQQMAQALGVDIKLLFTGIVGLGAALAALAGLLAAPLRSVYAGMGEDILVLAFVVVVIGGIGSIRGAFVAALGVGLIDTVGRAFLPRVLDALLSDQIADAVAPALSTTLIYLTMVVVLAIRPRGLFPAPGQ
ncbi:MAG: branched-chain amino acid ABC transporter permease [Alphaproteobacteria bacterium]|nr:branched-chain amino acid ABC transporter permease [Alphaproteobacteria bacterium]MBT5860121.1 branched-chain amino acid ABC transporter permease [Alphaproteobacteria bacterium]